MEFISEYKYAEVKVFTMEELEKNLQGIDQIIYARILNNSNSIIIRPNYQYGDPWFFLTYIFSY